MNVLIVNHHFEQDIEALLVSVPQDVEVRIISHTYFSDRARTVFPDIVFTGPLEEYYAPEHELTRARWRREARRVLEELFYLFPMDTVVVPSDTFFYIRDVGGAAKELGVQFIVVQKETSISPDGMNNEGHRQVRLFPMMADHMTVCSERHKRYWLLDNAPSKKIEVTGQPRFDLYTQPERWQGWNALGIKLSDPNRRKIVFFTYEVNAYLPENLQVSGCSWEQLRRETEESLVELVRSSHFAVIVKPHPQQDSNDLYCMRQRLRNLSGEAWSEHIVVLEPTADSRHLLVNADIVVAFQSTVVLEALAIGKPIIYTYWTDIVQLCEESLLPYHKYSNILHCARSPQQLISLILDTESHKNNVDPDVARSRLELVREYLGLMDGKASMRTWNAIQRTTIDRASFNQEQIKNRVRLADNQRMYCRKEMIIAILWFLFWRCWSILLKPAILTSYGRALLGKVSSRAQRQFTRYLECKVGLRHGRMQNRLLIGHVRERLLRF